MAKAIDFSIRDLFPATSDVKLISSKGKIVQLKELPRPTGSKKTITYGHTLHVDYLLQIGERDCSNLISFGDLQWFDKPLTGVVVLTYPIEGAATMAVKNIFTIGSLLWSVSKMYKEVYRRHRQFGVWGHSIRDLRYEGISLYKDGTIVPEIGS